MLPNRFPDSGDTPEYNSVDASLWFVVAVHDYLARAAGRRATRPRGAACAARRGDPRRLRGRHALRHPRPTTDGLLRAGVPGVQLTWMDARWATGWSRRASASRSKCRRSGSTRCASAQRGRARWTARRAAGARRFRRALSPIPRPAGSFDVVDVDHVAGARRPQHPAEPDLRGGRPAVPAARRRRRRAGSSSWSKRSLLTPLGLRTLAPRRSRLCAALSRRPRERDGAYHQGTVWPWLLGPFVEAWLRVQRRRRGGAGRGARRASSRRCSRISRRAGLGHVSEIADGDRRTRPAAARSRPGRSAN